MSKTPFVGVVNNTTHIIQETLPTLTMQDLRVNTLEFARFGSILKIRMRYIKQTYNKCLHMNYTILSSSL